MVRTAIPYRTRELLSFASAVVAVSILTALPLTGQVYEPVDLDAIYKIKEEGLQRSQAMELMTYLTDVHGPRLEDLQARRDDQRLELGLRIA